MNFASIPLAGAWLIEPSPRIDERGFFARTWCQREFAEHGLNPALVQCSISYNRRRATLRGLHFQAPPHAETKLVRCTRGAIHDVIVDLRPSSPTYRSWYGVELTADNRRLLYVPEGLAHGFITLADDTEVFYQIADYYVPEAARGLRWDDPAIGVHWPLLPAVISERDRSYPDFVP